MQTFRLFLSSPGDVMVERRRVAAVVSRLNGECVGRARIDTIRWETETYQAHATFQAQIPQAVECDLVLTIFKWRLGTELPPDFPDRLASGEPYPSGTAYELLTAVEQRRRGADNPDVFVYRYAGSSPRPEIDDPDRDRIETEWARLKTFFARWFVTPEGHFLAAYQKYASEDDLETQVDALLRRWLEDKIAAGRILAWPDAIKGSPFPGLEAYGFRHAAVFFGRDRDVARAVDLWRDVASKGAPFLLIVGASGSGKSSLARAGLAPRLTTPGVVEGVDLWRVAVFRPGDSPEGPAAALAAALLVADRDLPLSEKGRGPALPELASGEAEAAPSLARLFTTEPEAAAAAVAAALDGIGAAAQASERRERTVRVDLLLVVDQLDELFAPSLSGVQRDAFVAALSALVATGRVWVAATLRADLYAAMLDHAGLKALKEAGASYDLAPPGPAELAEIVRRPAEAADLAFGRDPATGETVEERLLREADRPDMLPLVQLALARLYEGRRADETGTVLPFDVYAGLGGLTGIIDEVGERALAGLGPAAVRNLPRLTRALAQMETEGALAGTLTVTPVRLAEAAPDESSRALVDALIASRLLTLTDAGDGSLVRLAHQRVLTDWMRTREIVGGSADFYRVRAEIDRRRLRWQANRRADLLLPRGLPLAEAESIVTRFGDEIAPETRAFVRASRARAGRAQLVTGIAAVVFGLVAVGAIVQWLVAREQTRLAERNFSVAREAVRGVVFNIVQGLGDVAGMRVDALRTILGTVAVASDQLARTAPDDPELLRTRGAMHQNFAKMYLTVGDIPSARADAERAVAIMRRLLATRADDIRVEGDLSVPLVTSGDVALGVGDLTGALRIYGEALELARKAAARAPDDAVNRRRITLPLNRIGEARLKAGDEPGARQAYRELLSVSRREVEKLPGDAERRSELAIVLADLAFVELESGDLEPARTGYEEAALISRALAAEFPANAGLQALLAVALINLGNLDLASAGEGAAPARFAEAVAIERELARRDPENAERQRKLAIALEKQGNGALALSDMPGALAPYGEALVISRALTARNPFDLRHPRSVAVGLSLVGGVKRRAGELDAARTSYEERLAICRDLASRQPESAEARRDLAIALRDLGALRQEAGDPPAALPLLHEAVMLSGALMRLDPAGLRPMRDHAELLSGLGRVQQAIGEAAPVLATMADQIAVLRRLIAMRPNDRDAANQLAAALLSTGYFRYSLDERDASLAALDESVAIFRRLAGSGDPVAQRRYETTLDVLGRIATVLQDRARASAAYREMAEIRRRQDDGGAPRRIALATVLVDLAAVESEPAPLMTEAGAILDALLEADLTPGARQTRDDVREWRRSRPSP